MTKSQKWAVAAIALFLVIIFKPYWEPTGRDEGSVAANAQGDGLSMAYAFLNQKFANRVAVKRSPYLDIKELEGVSAVLLLSPKTPLSAREEKILKKYVEDGGVVFVSAHDTITTANMRTLLDLFQLSRVVAENPGYQVGSWQQVLNKEEGQFIKGGETYAFYTQSSLAEHCDQPAMYCFTENFKVGKGRIILWLGLAPFSNGLIGQEHNLEILSRMVEQPGKIMFDEYHHLYSDYKMSDLLARPDFVISILSFSLAGLLYLIFAKPPELEVIREEASKNDSTLSFYKLYENVFTKQIEGPKTHDATLNQHAEWLARQPGISKDGAQKVLSDTGGTGSFLRAASRLIQFHKRSLKERKGTHL